MSTGREWNDADDGANELSLTRLAIGTYDGVPGHGRFATEWLQNFNLIAEFHQWSPDLKLKSAPRYLVGKALEWYWSEKSAFASWSLFELAFKRAFATGRDDVHNYLRMKGRVQRNDETAIMYFSDKVRLCETVGLKFARVKEEILCGLSSRELADSLLTGEHADAADVLRDIVEFESVSVGPSPASAEQSAAALRTPVTGSPKPRDETSVSNASGDAAPLADNNGSISYEKIAKINRLFLVPCVIDGDTPECLLQEAVARRFKIPWCTAYTITVYERRTQTITRALGSARVSVAIDGALLDDFLIFVVPNDACPKGMVVGRSWCESSRIVYDKHERGIRFYNVSDFPFANTDVTAPSPSSNRLVTSSVANLAPGKVTRVSALAGKTTFDAAVFNGTAEFVTLQAGHLLARRVEVIPGTGTRRVPFARYVTHDDIRLPEEFDVKEREQLLELLNKHRQCFVQSPDDPSRAVAEETEERSRPVVGSSFLDWLSKRGHGSSNETCRSPGTDSSHALPVLRVHKKPGETRVMVNCDKMGTLTYPLPSAEHCLNRFSGFALFARLDIVHEHLDIPAGTKKDIDARTVTCLNNAPFTLTTTVNWSSLNVKKGTPINFLDHYFVTAHHWDDLTFRLDAVLTMLRKANLTLRLSKCVFASRSIEFLGYEIVASSVRPSQKKILEIVQYKTPETIRGVRRFIGLAGFFQKFVPEFAEIVGPITDLARKRRTFAWTDKQQNAFECLKLQLTASVPVLQIYDSTHDNRLRIDASANMLSAVLFQTDNDGKENMVRCMSRATSDIERTYHSSKLTLKAILWGLERYCYWFQNTTVVVVTDCQSLVYMNAMKTTDLECFQYFEVLTQKYDFQVIHKAGTRIEYVKKNVSFTKTDVRKTNYMQEMQHGDPEILQTIKELMSDRPRHHLNKYQLQEGLLYCSVHTANGIRRLLVVPKTMRKSIMIHYHDLQGHLTLDKTLEMLQETYYFPKARRYARLHIKFCSVCISQNSPRDQRQNIQLGNRPFDTIRIKHSGPFPKSNGNQYAFVVVDNITLYTSIYPSPSCTTTDAIRALERFTKTFRLPKQIVSDQSHIYKSLQFCTFLETNNIQHRKVSTQKSQVNHEVERINDAILAVIYTYINNNNEWDQALDKIEIFLNTTEIPAVNTSPFKAVLNFSTAYECTILDFLRVQEPHYNLPREVRDELSLRVDFGQTKWKAWYKPHCATKKLYPGTIVFLQDPAETSQIKYLGPMVVIKRCTKFTYEIVQFGFSKGQCSYVFDVNVSSLKMYEGTIIISSRYDTESNIVDHKNPGKQIKTSTADSTPRKFWLLPSGPVTL